mgnify:FL=1
MNKNGKIDNDMTTQLTGIYSFMDYDDLWYIPMSRGAKSKLF